MKYKVGDKVRVRDWADTENEFGLFTYLSDTVAKPNVQFFDTMHNLCGKVLTISGTLNNKYYAVNECNHFFTNEMFSGLVEAAPTDKNHSVIIVKQGAGHYLFLCDRDVPIGSTVLCETAYGRKDGITVTPAFSVNDDEYANLLKQFGTKESRMKKVIGTVEYHLFEDGDKA